MQSQEGRADLGRKGKTRPKVSHVGSTVLAPQRERDSSQSNSIVRSKVPFSPSVRGLHGLSRSVPRVKSQISPDETGRRQRAQLFAHPKYPSPVTSCTCRSSRSSGSQPRVERDITPPSLKIRNRNDVKTRASSPSGYLSLLRLQPLVHASNYCHSHSHSHSNFQAILTAHTLTVCNRRC